MTMASPSSGERPSRFLISSLSSILPGGSRLKLVTSLRAPRPAEAGRQLTKKKEIGPLLAEFH
jgi:hypothetical protein